MPLDIRSCQQEQIFQISMSSMTVTSAALSWLIPRAIWEITYDQLKEKEMTSGQSLWGHVTLLCLSHPTSAHQRTSPLLTLSESHHFFSRPEPPSHLAWVAEVASSMFVFHRVASLQDTNLITSLPSIHPFEGSHLLD